MKVLQFLLITIYFMFSFYLVAGGLIRLDYQEKLDKLKANRASLESKEIKLDFDDVEFNNQYSLEL